MPKKVVDFSAVSEIIRDEPFHLHFWECMPEEYVKFLMDPRAHLESMGLNLPDDMRIETTIENHDWMARSTRGLSSNNGTIICNVGTGNVARAVYRIVSFAHDHESVGKFDKQLLHAGSEPHHPEFGV